MGLGEVDAGELDRELSGLARSTSSSSSSSSTSVAPAPPPPPPGFNPPPDFSNESLTHGISPPPSGTSSGTSSTTASASTSHTALQEAVNRIIETRPAETARADATDDEHLRLDYQFNAEDASQSPAPSSPSGPRPQLRAIQRLSSESVPVSGQSSRSSLSTVSTGSEGGPHLVEMRERLLSEVSASVSGGSGSSSRRDSSGSGGGMQLPRSSSGSGFAIDEAFEMHVTNPTPPLREDPLLTEDALSIVDGALRPRSDSMDSVEDAAIHAWDSVWPQPNAPHQVNLPPEVSSSKFPLAPMSPYQTPSFTPALISARSGPSLSLSPDRERDRDRDRERERDRESFSQSPVSQQHGDHSRRRESFNEGPGTTSSRVYGHQRSRSGASPTRGGSSHTGPSKLSESYASPKNGLSPITATSSSLSSTASSLSASTSAPSSASTPTPTPASPTTIPSAQSTTSGPSSVSSSALGPQSPRIHRLSLEVGRPTSPATTRVPSRGARPGSPVLRSALGSSPPKNTPTPPVPFLSSPVSASAPTRARGKSISFVLSPAPPALEPITNRADSPRPEPPILARRNSEASILVSNSGLQFTAAAEEAFGYRFDDVGAPNSFPPISLPPAGVPPPNLANEGVIAKVGDDGLGIEALKALSPPTVEQAAGASNTTPLPPLYAPVARPAILRRAFSEQDARARSSDHQNHPRTMSNTGELERSAKRPQGLTDLRPLVSSAPGVDLDTVRNSKSPRRSPFPLPTMSSISSEGEDQGYFNVEAGGTVGDTFQVDEEDEDEFPQHVEHAGPGMQSDFAFPARSSAGVGSSSPMPGGALSTPGLAEWPGTSGGAGGSGGAATPMGGWMTPDATGDVFPETGGASAFDMDVTFDDEGLNTLERIFLLSRSEYAFHRAYVARVLGDLLVDVDPCESVEYVLPLVSGFSMDEDETVKEAFATELHRILWYFYSTCQLVINDVPVEELYDAAPGEVTTVTSEGVQVVPRPSAAEVAGAEVVPMNIADRRASVVSLGPSSGGLTYVGSSLSPLNETDTPGSEATAASSHSAMSATTFVNTFTDSDDGGKGWAKDAGRTIEQPALAVDFFRPLLGTLLLSDNPAIADPVRTGIIAIIGRLRDKTPLTVDAWGVNVSTSSKENGSPTKGKSSERRTYVSQTGPHSHEIRPFSPAARAMVENEILQGIVIGMGRLNTDIPETMFAETLEGGQRALEMYAEPGLHGEDDQGGGFEPNVMDSSTTSMEVEAGSSTATGTRRQNSDDGDIHIDQAHRRSFDLASHAGHSQYSVGGEAYGMTNGAPVLDTVVNESMDTFTNEGGQGGPGQFDMGYGAEHGADQDTEAELYREQMIHEARVGRALSLSFIGSISEFYSPEEIVQHGFVDEVLRGSDGDDTTRAEAALAMSLLAKVVPVEHVYRMIPVFQTFAVDEVDHVRQSSCLCLPALCRRIEAHEHRRAFATDAIAAFVRASTPNASIPAGTAAPGIEGGDTFVFGGQEPFGHVPHGGNEDENVRYAALEMLGEVIHAFAEDPAGPPAELLRVYLDDSAAGMPDSDWDVIASYNFPGVCLTLGPERWPELRDLFHRLRSRAGDRVLSTIAAFLHELARILTPEQVATDILPAYRTCLASSDPIRERVFENVDVVISRVPTEVGWKLFTDLAESWDEGTLGGWRVRERLALHIPAFLQAFSTRPTRETGDEGQGTPRGESERDTESDAETITDAADDTRLEQVLDMMRAALLDPFAAVRDAATLAVPTSYEILNEGTRSAEKFRNILLDLAHSSKYRQRLTFVRCLREFVKPPPNRSAFEEFFVPCLKQLSTDVVDVRLGLAQAIANLFVIGAFYDDVDVPIPEEVQRIANLLAGDDAPDVRNTVNHISPDRLASGQVTIQVDADGNILPPFHTPPQDKPNRAAGPGEQVKPASGPASTHSGSDNSGPTTVKIHPDAIDPVDPTTLGESIESSGPDVKTDDVQEQSRGQPYGKMGLARKDSLGVSSALGEMHLGGGEGGLGVEETQNNDEPTQLAVVKGAVPEVADPFEASFSLATQSGE